MEKLIYLVWARKEPEANQLREELFGKVVPRLLKLGAAKLSLNIDDQDSDVPTPLPAPEGEIPLIAQVSVWLDCLDFRGPYEEALASIGTRRAGYLVTESLYTEYGDNEFATPRDWSDGERSPGVMIVTLLEKPSRLSYDDWVHHWHLTQSPLSAEIQPRVRYVRNAVVRPVTPDAPTYHGIVEEVFPSPEHITDPMKFYCADGSEKRLEANMEAMMRSVSDFLDIDRIRTTTMSEYLLKS